MSVLSKIEALLGESDNVTTRAYVASLVAKTSKCKLIGLTGYSSKASAQFIQIFDLAHKPADGAIPDIVISVAATTSFSLSFAPGRKFRNGIVVACSSTGPTLTIGSADIWLDVQVA